MRARAASALLAAALVVGLSACVPEPQPGEARRDPAPSFADARTTQVDGDGESWTTGDVSIDVPAGAVTVKVAGIAVGAEIGVADSGIARETFGTPVRIETTAALHDPATVTWDVGALDPGLAEAAVLVAWDDDVRVWRPVDTPLTVADGALSAQLDTSGVVTWATGALSAPAATPDPAAPACDGPSLPGWVAVFGDPDRARDDAALPSCPENPQGDELTVHAASASPVTRALEAQEGAGWQWATRHDAAGRFWTLAASLVDDERTVLLPPSATVDVGFRAPSDPAVPLRAVARVDARTATVDVLAAFARQVSLGEVADASVDALLTALYECGASQAGALTDPAAATAVGAALTACDLGPVEHALAGTIRDSDDDAAVQGARAAATAVRLAAQGRFDDIAASHAEMLAAAAALPQGGASFTVLARRDAPALGSWTPTCTDPAADSMALFGVLAVQPQFVGVPRDIAADPEWRDAVVTALAPLARCTPAQQAAFAMQVPGEWNDPDAAGVVVEELAGLGLSLLTCDELFAAAAPLAAGFSPASGVTAGRGQLACAWGADAGKDVADASQRALVQVWVSREAGDAAAVASRRGELEKLPDNGLQQSAAITAADGYLLGSYVPTGLELEARVPGYRIVITTTSATEPVQWRMQEGIAAAEAVVAAVAG